MKLATFALATLLIVPFGRTAAASDGGPAPYLTIRALKMMQDRIAVGEAGAAGSHARMLVALGQSFSRVKPAVWGDPRNARALALYLFSGGTASLIAEHVAPENVAKDQRPLYEGALDYALGRDDEARAKLLAIEPRSLPSGLGGHLALVQSALIASFDKDKALLLLDTARLLEPGSLVEEAALRKEMMLLGTDESHIDKFALLARRYAYVFRKSAYADNFRMLIRDAARADAVANDLASALRLTKIAASLDAADRRQFYLTVAREAVLAGRLVMASFTAEEAEHLAHPGDKDDARAKLYFGSAAIVGARYEHGLRALQSIDDSKLDQRDRLLRQAALSLGTMVRRPSFISPPAAGAKELAALAAGEQALTEAADTIKLANK